MPHVRTRFAPSPTGALHVGGARTAMYAWLLAKHFGGEFLLRIEDTDQERFVPGGIRFIIEELEMLGITPDEGPSHEELKKVGEYWESAPACGGKYGPYIQSLRRAGYGKAANVLIEKGAAYRCDCTPEMLERERNEQMARKELPGYSGYCRTRNVPADKPHVVRFKMPEKRRIELHDAIKGLVTWDAASLRDPVLLKSDGLPTYHLAVVCDDHDMKISHIMRGDEWMSSAPLHILLYEAFGWDAPVFAHLPTVNGTDGKKLSKRRGAPSAGSLRDQGYLPEAILNYVVLVGWSPGDGEEQEVFTRDELVKRFSLKHVNPASATFDHTKLTWMNGVYIRNLSPEEFIKRIDPFMQKHGYDAHDGRFKKIAALVQERIKVLAEVPEMVSFLYAGKIERELPLLTKDFDKEKVKDYLSRVENTFKSLSDSFEKEEIEAALRALAKELAVKPGPLFGVIRIAVMGKPVTPPLFESLSALGKKRVLELLKEAAAAF
jgi:glutamyl-tRNA synthetase